MTDAEMALAANEEFYRAFAQGDLMAMDTLWAGDDDVTCIHPGWDILGDRYSVLQSWQSILAAPPPVECRNARVWMSGSVAVVICDEVIVGDALAATNVYVLEEDGWKICHHHASQILAAVRDPVAPQAANDPSPSIH